MQTIQTKVLYVYKTSNNWFNFWSSYSLYVISVSFVSFIKEFLHLI